MHKWVVCDPKDKNDEEIKANEEKQPTDYFNVYESVDQLPQGYLGLVRPSMFPDTEDKMKNDYKLHHTIRLLPHDQNTGGFYLGLIRKLKDVVYQQTSNPQQKPAEKTTKTIEEEIIQEEKAIHELDNETKNISKDFLVEDEGENKNVPKSKDEEEGGEDEEEEEEPSQSNANNEESKDPNDLQIKKPERKKKKKYCELTDDEWDWIQDHYGFQDQSLKKLFIQQTEGEKKILFVSPGIKKLREIDIKSGKIKNLYLCFSYCQIEPRS